jgi:hypothetical protein
MASAPNQKPAADVRLLLRTHAEAGWLNHEVLPAVRELEQRRGLPEEQLAAALAYLEVIWNESRKRAEKTDATCAELETPHSNPDRNLHGKACRYHALVRRLRDSLARRVALALTLGDCIR